MAKFQTEIKNEDAIRLGSIKFEIGTPGEAEPIFEDLGAGRSASYQEGIEIVKIESDNAPPLEKVKRQFADIKFIWLEPTTEKIAKIRGALDTYTPAAGSDTLTTGGKRDIGYIPIRLTNTNAAEKTYQVTFHRARVSKGIEQTFGKDSELDPAGIPLEFHAEEDPTRVIGDQLFEIVDMQAPATPATLP